MTIILLLSLICVVAAGVMGVKNGEYRTGTFWFLVALCLVVILPLVPIRG